MPDAINKVTIDVTVNGQKFRRQVEPRLLLVEFIREELGLTGTHVGCDTSYCGACTVQLNGAPVKSCTAAPGSSKWPKLVAFTPGSDAIV